MANEEVLGPRKTMFVLVIVVGCFAVLWPRILSPLILGHTREQLKPNQFDRDAGCCEVIFETEVAVLELINEVCKSSVGVDGHLSPLAAAECRKSVNETCGVDIAAFLKRTENVGKTTKKLIDTMKSSNSSCLKEHFGVPVWSLSLHPAVNSWIQQDTLKQERPPMRGGGPHPALRERGRAIPAGAPTPPSRGPVPLPPHIRVRSSPLSVYFELDIKPPPIPGMRPPLGSPGGPVPAPKSSMGFVMPIYTICIIVFFVYTLSKILFKRTGSVPYDQISPDPQFRRRVFRDDSRSSPDTKLVVTAISGLVAEVQQQMEASYAQNQQRQDVQDNHTRPYYTNGSVTVLSNSSPVQIITSEYREPSEEKSPEYQKEKEPSPEPKEPMPEPKESSPEVEDSDEVKERPDSTEIDTNHTDATADLIALTENIDSGNKDSVAKSTENFLEDAKDFKIVSTTDLESAKKEKQSTPELLEEALKEETREGEGDMDGEKGSVKVVGMELTTHTADGGTWPRAELPPVTPLPPTRPPHEADEVKSIFLETEIPQQSRVLVADFMDRADGPAATKDASMVVSGKMTLSLIQDAPRETPERDPESTVDEFTTASAVTQPAAEKDDLSDEEIEEEIEVEEIEEEIEVEEEEEPIEEIKKVLEPVKELLKYETNEQAAEKPIWKEEVEQKTVSSELQNIDESKAQLTEELINDALNNDGSTEETNESQKVEESLDEQYTEEKEPHVAEKNQDGENEELTVETSETQKADLSNDLQDEELKAEKSTLTENTDGVTADESQNLEAISEDEPQNKLIAPAKDLLEATIGDEQQNELIVTAKDFLKATSENEQQNELTATTKDLLEETSEDEPQNELIPKTKDPSEETSEDEPQNELIATTKDLLEETSEDDPQNELIATTKDLLEATSEDEPQNQLITTAKDLLEATSEDEQQNKFVATTEDLLEPKSEDEPQNELIATTKDLLETEIKTEEKQNDPVVEAEKAEPSNAEDSTENAEALKEEEYLKEQKDSDNVKESKKGRKGRRNRKGRVTEADEKE